MPVASLDVVANGGFEFTSAAIGTATQLFVDQVGEEALNLIDPSPEKARYLMTTWIS